MRIRYVGIKDWGTIRLTVREFLQFGAKVRAVLVCDEMVSFFDHRGRTIPMRDALIELHDTWMDDDFDDTRVTTRPAPRSGKRPSFFSDRRQHERHEMTIPVSIVGEEGNEVGFTENISEGGMLFKSPVPLSCGETVTLRVPLAGTAEAVVIRCEPEEDDGHVTAVAFVPLFARAA